MLGNDVIDRSQSEVHLGMDRNEAGNVDIGARVQTGRHTMYARWELGPMDVLGSLLPWLRICGGPLHY